MKWSPSGWCACRRRRAATPQSRRHPPEGAQPARPVREIARHRLRPDALRTAVAPGFSEIGQLAAIAAIRTVLNFFLSREIAQERVEIERDRKAAAPRAAAS
ncbi:DUF1622 domain-containing protein [Streptomyces sp. NPDC058701]|uniref:DUF1622 domain-containing protein n=1 Tax=Streptomyces sp. NPDC058701 TaxID=3346608 RepID=UPI003666FD36